jgi:hypothetical protein
VAAEIGHDDDVAGIEDGNELLFDIPELPAELVRRPVSLIARPEAQRQRTRRSPPRCDDSGLGRSA